MIDWVVFHSVHAWCQLCVKHPSYGHNIDVIDMSTFIISLPPGAQDIRRNVGMVYLLKVLTKHEGQMQCFQMSIYLHILHQSREHIITCRYRMLNIEDITCHPNDGGHIGFTRIISGFESPHYQKDSHVMDSFIDVLSGIMKSSLRSSIDDQVHNIKRSSLL